ncbi:hypothetical protein BCR36DRAFT_356784 [Piromyces finnis]|uniref:Tubulin--tyrosine ligase-like protein 12 SET-like domain-containing protein n=1 Tax=Piromyces finnis TaxID=1754191 RepID=A0A1Y1V458_9FUNG|nr:hypothetical protein BCR36DRAFT_356784 [Piromyces finnis]|eukprot:ORX46675.1 hypothetical protein BCR36DRAFT_356784 [Piromyces finnis]
MTVSDEVNQFINFHKHQLQSVPESLWENLYNKLKNQTFNSGDFFEIRVDESKVRSLHLKDGCNLNTNSDVFLIDHSWTTNPENAAGELLNTSGLLKRMEGLFNINYNEEEVIEEDESEKQMKEELIKLVCQQANVNSERAKDALERHSYEVINAIDELTTEEEYNSDVMEGLKNTIASQMPTEVKEKDEKKSNEPTVKQRINRIVKYDMWKYINVYQYTVLTDGEEENIISWYFFDEVGNAIQHSNEPNVVCIPFIFNNGKENVEYSLFYPIKDIKSNEVITRNKLPVDLKEHEKKAYLMSFVDKPLDAMTNECSDLIESAKEWKDKKGDKDIELKTPDVVDPLEKPTMEIPKIKIYTDLISINNNLKCGNIEFVDDINEAEVIWIFGEVEQFKNNQKLSRFPNQLCITNPLYLKLMLSKVYGNNNDIQCESYDMTTEMTEFVGSYLANAKKIEEEKKNNKDDSKVKTIENNNFWILKPIFGNNGSSKPSQWIITDSLPKIIRQHDTKLNMIIERFNNGKKPLLYNNNVKFQLRFYALLNSTMDGLSLYMYDQNYIVYLAKEFWSDKLSNIYKKEIHFVKYKQLRETTKADETNMNINRVPYIHHTKLENYIEKQYNCKWNDIKDKIYKNIKAVFSAAMSSSEPLGFSEICLSLPSFFSLFAVDVEIYDDLSPYIVNVEYMPDGEHIVNYDKDFLSKVICRVTNGVLGNVEDSKNAFVQL